MGSKAGNAVKKTSSKGRAGTAGASAAKKSKPVMPKGKTRMTSGKSVH